MENKIRKVDSITKTSFNKNKSKNLFQDSKDPKENFQKVLQKNVDQYRKK